MIEITKPGSKRYHFKGAEHVVVCNDAPGDYPVITTLIERLRKVEEALTRGQGYADQAGFGYGCYRPKNPNDFTPDAEFCTAEEIANHKAACEAYNAGTYQPDIHILRAPWGIGTYQEGDEEIDAALTDLRNLIKELENSHDRQHTGAA